MPSAVINVVITLWLLCGKYMLCTVLEIADYSHSSMDGLGWVEWVAISMLKRQVQSAIDAGVPVSLIQRAVAHENPRSQASYISSSGLQENGNSIGDTGAHPERPAVLKETSKDSSWTHSNVWICEWFAPVKIYFCSVPRWPSQIWHCDRKLHCKLLKVNVATNLWKIYALTSFWHCCLAQGVESAFKWLVTITFLTSDYKNIGSFLYLKYDYFIREWYSCSQLYLQQYKWHSRHF